MRFGSGVAVALGRPVATAPTGPLAWEPPYAAGVALEKTKNKQKEMTFIICLPLYSISVIRKRPCLLPSK